MWCRYCCSFNKSHAFREPWDSLLSFMPLSNCPKSLILATKTTVINCYRWVSGGISLDHVPQDPALQNGTNCSREPKQGWETDLLFLQAVSLNQACNKCVTHRSARKRLYISPGQSHMMRIRVAKGYSAATGPWSAPSDISGFQLLGSTVLWRNLSVAMFDKQWTPVSGPANTVSFSNRLKINVFALDLASFGNRRTKHSKYCILLGVIKLWQNAWSPWNS